MNVNIRQFRRPHDRKRGSDGREIHYQGNCRNYVDRRNLRGVSIYIGSFMTNPIPTADGKTPQKTEPKTIEDWVVELSNYECGSIGRKIEHRLDVMRRMQRQTREMTLEEAAELLDITNGQLKGSKTINSTYAGKMIRDLK